MSTPLFRRAPHTIHHITVMLMNIKKTIRWHTLFTQVDKNSEVFTHMFMHNGNSVQYFMTSYFTKIINILYFFKVSRWYGNHWRIKDESSSYWHWICCNTKGKLFIKYVNRVGNMSVENVWYIYMWYIQIAMEIKSIGIRNMYILMTEIQKGHTTETYNLPSFIIKPLASRKIIVKNSSLCLKPCNSQHSQG